MNPDRYPLDPPMRAKSRGHGQPSPDAQHIAAAIREAAVTVAEAILATSENGTSEERIREIVNQEFTLLMTGIGAKISKATVRP